MKTFILPSILLAAILAVAIAPIADDVFAQQQVKPDKPQKPQKCQVKVQLKVLGAVPGTIYTAQVDGLLAQSKQLDAGATDTTIAFNFQYKKGETCPAKDGVIYGNVNGEQFSGIIKSLTKPNKITYELEAVPPLPEPLPPIQ